MKRMMTMLLTAALLVSTALAAGESADRAAQLHELGLFQGVGNGALNEETMALDRPATRVEGVAMLVRVLGKEEEAKLLNADCPFSDVDDWAKPYVGYACDRGLTMGVGGGRFGSLEPLGLNQFTTMLLRALGYRDGEDFIWSESETFALELGLFDEAWLAGSAREQIDRGGMVDLSWFALHQPQKGNGATLLEEIRGSAEAPAEPQPGPDPEPAPKPDPDPKPNPDPDPEPEKSEAEQVLDLVNAERAERGLEPLVLDETLTQAAQLRAEEVGETFSHTRPDGTSCFTVLKEFGLNYRSAGENIAKGQRSPKSVMTSWMNSDGHRGNILDSSYTRIGVGYVAETRAWVQLFLLP